MTATEHRLAVLRTARFYQIGDAGPATHELWLCCHGYGQLAARFVRHFEDIASPARVIVAPEAPHRFYLDATDRPAAERRVGASWMTREDRTTDIADYVAYLDAVADRVLAAAPADVQLTAFGFSQGTATVARWTAATKHTVKRLILWGSGLPPDLDWASAAARFQRLQLRLVAGAADGLVTPERISEQEELLIGHNVPYNLTRFAGGHEMDAATLRALAT